MRAYDLAMTMIFINCAFPIIEMMGITLPSSIASQYGALTALNALYIPLFKVGGIDISGLTILAAALAAGTIVIASTHTVTDRGIAMTVFTAVFWGSFTTASLVLMPIILHFNGFTVFWGIFLLASTLIFINAMVQFPLGGEWGQI